VKLKSHIAASSQERVHFGHDGTPRKGLKTGTVIVKLALLLERSPTMSVVPYLTISGGRGAEAAEFYTKLFGAKEGMRMPAEDKKRLMHCELEFAGNRIFLSDEFQTQNAKPAMSSVFVGLDKPQDVDALANKAKAMGASIDLEPQDMFWGDRYAQFTDPFGHAWQAGAPKGG
jgi:PhnB protein